MNETLAPVAVNTSSGPGAVSWGAIIAGAAGAAALSLILLILGTGLGASSVSPWAGQGAAAATFGVSTILWITFTQLAASGTGGYLAGRLRTRWAGTHTDEVYFRDTAHGFLAWAVSTLLTAAVLTSAVTSIVGSGAQAVSNVAGGVAGAAATAVPTLTDKAGQSGDTGEATGYFVDTLFRKDAAAPATAADPSTTTSAEVSRIMANGIASGVLAPEDTRYVGQLVAHRTGLSQADAEKRVTDIFTAMQTKAKNAETAAREAADKARKASAYGALWLFVSLMVGAFVASLAATYGGRRRDLI